MTAAFLLGAAALLLLGKRKQTVEGIGRVKRRVYVEIEAVQNAGVPLHEKYINLSADNIASLREIGERFGWKQTRRSVESGKEYSEAYFNSLRRAYNAVTGVQGVGSTGSHKVRNADGKVILEWRDIEAATEHIKQEQNLAELESRLAKQRRSIRNTRRGYNLAPVPPSYQDEQLYEQSKFPDQPQQLELFGVELDRVGFIQRYNQWNSTIKSDLYLVTMQINEDEPVFIAFDKLDYAKERFRFFIETASYENYQQNFISDNEDFAWLEDDKKNEMRITLRKIPYRKSKYTLAQFL